MDTENIRKHWTVYKGFFKMYWKSRLIYKQDFILGFISQGLNLVFSLAFLTLIFTQVDSISGWSFDQMLLLTGFSGMVLNIHHIFLFSLYSLGQDYILNGRFDRFLVRPLNPLFQVYASYLSDNNLSKLIANVALTVYAAIAVGIPITLTNIGYGLTAIASGVMVIGAIFLTLATTAFWTGRSKAVFWLFFQVSNFRKYPFPIYPEAVKILLITLMPIAFSSFFPASFLLGKSGWFQWQMASLVIGPLFYIGAYQFWKFGVSNYSSTGS